MFVPKNIAAAGDDLNRGIAIVNTVWLALQRCETDLDYNQAIDTLYEGQQRLLSAERHIGLHQNTEAAS